MAQMKLNLLFHNIQENNWWIHRNISDTGRFKSFSAHIVHWNKWSFPVVGSSNLLSSISFDFPPPLPSPTPWIREFPQIQLGQWESDLVWWIVYQPKDYWRAFFGNIAKRWQKIKMKKKHPQRKTFSELYIPSGYFFVTWESSVSIKETLERNALDIEKHRHSKRIDRRKLRKSS